MSDQDYTEGKGVVVDCLPGAVFRVKIDEEVFGKAHEVLATISGRMRKSKIRILPGDRVTLEISLFDFSKGRITFRDKV